MAESHAPVLEMLWEADDPRRALDERFGFSGGESASRWVAAMLDAHWGVRVHSCEVWAAGAILARLQDALAAYPDVDRVAALAGAPRPLTERITDWLDWRSEHVPAPARDALRGLVADAPPDQLPVQLGHHDFRSGNVLCAGAKVAAVIDFEDARLDPPVVELTRSAVLLGTRFRNWGPVSSEVRAGFLAGYQSVRRLTAVEARWWDILLLWHAVAMVPPGADPTGWGPSALSHLAELAGRS
jgi:homoserine kinase type II